jgi:predicted nucleotidyltransferase
VTLLQQRDCDRQRRRLQVYEDVRKRLKDALAELAPGKSVFVFGSLTSPGVFNDRSDVDIALEDNLPNLNTWQLTAELMERLERPVDIVLLERCRFADKIRREGERWTS